MLQAILKETLKIGEYENFLSKNDWNIRKTPAETQEIDAPLFSLIPAYSEWVLALKIPRPKNRTGSIPVGGTIFKRTLGV